MDHSLVVSIDEKKRKKDLKELDEAVVSEVEIVEEDQEDLKIDGNSIKEWFQGMTNSDAN